MKQILKTIVLFFLINKASGQKLPTDSLTGKIIYKEIVRADSLSKSDLHTKINEWFAKNYKSSSDVIQYNSKEDGKIIGKGILNIIVIHRYNNIKTPMSMKIAYTISINIKDYRFKYEIENLYVVTDMGQYPLESYTTDKEKLKTEVQKSIKNENQLEKRVQEQIEFTQGILNETDKEINEIIHSVKQIINIKVSEEW